jgi:hypothetical protein
MRIRVAVPEKHVEPTVIEALAEAVTRVNEHMIRAGEVPTFHDGASHVRWRPENLGDEHFDHAGTVLQRGWGDCDDLAPWHAASLRTTGEDPGAVTRVVPSGPNTLHVLVQRSSGEFEDPSVTCGMKPHRKGVVGGEDGNSLHIWAHDPHDGRIYEGSLAPTTAPMKLHGGPVFGVRPTVGGLYEGRCDVPWVGSRMTMCGVDGRAHRHHRGQVHVRSYYRRFPKVVGVPHFLSVTGRAQYPHEALNAAIVGAVLAGEASQSMAPKDRYKLLALQGLLAGMNPHDVTVAIAQHMKEDAAAAAHVHGYVVGDFLDFVGDAVQVVAPIAGAALGGPVGGMLGGMAGKALGGMIKGSGGGGGGGSQQPAMAQPIPPPPMPMGGGGGFAPGGGGGFAPMGGGGGFAPGGGGGYGAPVVTPDGKVAAMPGPQPVIVRF